MFMMVNSMSSVSRKKFQPPQSSSTFCENMKPVPETAQLVPASMRGRFSQALSRMNQSA